MRVFRWAGAAVVVLAVLAVAAWIFREPLVMTVSRLSQPKVGPTQTVTWAKGPAAPEAGERPPNVVFILVDDLGFNDITLNGGIDGGSVPTPNIDSLARDGVTFANGYAGNATCAPSRAAIMTGRYPTRFGFEFTPTPVAFSRMVGSFRNPDALHPPRFARELARDVPPLDDLGVPTDEVTIAELLKTRGYHTVHLGKWHLGGSKGSRPEDQGFDESLGFMAGGSMFLPENDPNAVNSKQDFDPIDRFLWANLPFGVQFNGGKLFKPTAYMTDYLTDQAVASIEANRNRPFFMYLAYNAPHTPLQATKADYEALSHIEDHRLRVYAAMLRNLDRNIGRVLESLKAQGLDENTLVIFTSDNGGAHYVGLPELNRPYRGWKATFFEGGIHVPFLMRWPAQIPAGSRFSSPIGHVDIFSTTAGAAGASPPSGKVLDGVNLLPFLDGRSPGDPHETMFWRSGEYRVLLSDGWKLQKLRSPDKTWLFNLAEDPHEKTNLAAAQPEKVRELSAMLDLQDAQMVKPRWPSLLRGAIAIDHPLGVKDKASDEFVYWNN